MRADVLERFEAAARELLEVEGVRVCLIHDDFARRIAEKPIENVTFEARLRDPYVDLVFSINPTVECPF